ncbi:MAG: class I SAM-dependent methyltransferase [Opitutus sp.]|nr:class I SAM-dependent methyltransferase [Opitutus sp.]MCS6248593.1 class I SAM-dependent methyltransferase [Opitutus sp.]MCS6274304.1 class I SAM-dependent methyltransferase [Opitutus sp.]MCS6278613.1 class I SAM-dependent methyltransferase [Opitutus sp.]MCS6298484.1 class I SAM-dependent methyltransferase [Opitutus sp.]
MTSLDSSTARDDQTTIAFFSKQLERHQEGPLAVNWGSQAGQDRRFAVLAGIGDMTGCRVLDVGCGLGGFYDWQLRQGLGLDYVGVDITPGMIEAARLRHPGVDFQVANVLATDPGQFDYVIASGIFYLRQHEPEAFLERMVTRLFGLARRGVAVNSLSTWSPRRDAGEFYADPVHTLEFCRSLTSAVVLRHDYHPGDFTLYLHQAAFAS